MSAWNLMWSFLPYISLVYFLIILLTLEWRWSLLSMLWGKISWYFWEERKWKRIVATYEANLSIDDFRERCDEIAKANPELSELEIIAKAKKETKK